MLRTLKIFFTGVPQPAITRVNLLLRIRPSTYSEEERRALFSAFRSNMRMRLSGTVLAAMCGYLTPPVEVLVFPIVPKAAVFLCLYRLAHTAAWLTLERKTHPLITKYENQTEVFCSPEEIKADFEKMRENRKTQQEEVGKTQPEVEQMPQEKQVKEEEKK